MRDPEGIRISEACEHQHRTLAFGSCVAVRLPFGKKKWKLVSNEPKHRWILWCGLKCHRYTTSTAVQHQSHRLQTPGVLSLCVFITTAARLRRWNSPHRSWLNSLCYDWGGSMSTSGKSLWLVHPGHSTHWI